MDVGIIDTGLTAMQTILNVVNLLKLTDNRYPPQAKVNDGASFDYIILGGGSAGCVLANRLTEDPNISVLLIEAGGNPPLQSNLPGLVPFNIRSPVDWNYETANRTYKCHKDGVDRLPRGKLLGGSSGINFMYYIRGAPHDYDTWADITGDETWKYENVLPYFKKSEKQMDPAILSSPTANFHGTKGPLGVTTARGNLDDFLRAFEELGNRINIDLNSDDVLGFAKAPITVADGIRQSTANTFLYEAKGRSNLHVLKNHLVAKINFVNKRAKSVRVLNDKGKELTIIVKKEIILSAGAYNSPQILMLSGIGPKNHLESLGIEVIADLPVGENLRDHKFVGIPYTLHGFTDASLPRSLNEYPFPTAIGFGALNKSQGYPDWQITSGHGAAVTLLCFFLPSLK